MGSHIPLNINVNHAIKLYESGKSMDQIGEELRVSRSTIERRFVKAGFQFRRTKREIYRILSKQRYGDVSAAIREYVAGMTMLEVSRKFKIPYRHLQKEIVEAGETLRTQAQSLGLRYTQMTKAERQAITLGANKAKRGKPASQKSMERRAKTMENTLQLAGKDDLVLCVWLAQRGVKFTMQKAVGPYNIDIAFDEKFVAIEVKSVLIDTPRGHRALIFDPVTRREYLLNRGWRIIEVVHQGVRWLRPSCADKIIALLNSACTNKTARSQYCMIGGDGEPLP